MSTTFLSLTSLLFLLATTSPATSSLAGNLPASPILSSPNTKTTPHPTTTTNSTAFIRACCTRTRYPRLCFTSLASMASSIQSDHARLAVAATNLTLHNLRSLAAHISSLRRSKGSTLALRDCADTVGSATDQVRRTMERLDGIEKKVSPEVMWRVGDAQTWLSAAMTNEGTCADGLRGKEPSPPVSDEVRRAMQYTSIALALVNLLVTNR